MLNYHQQRAEVVKDLQHMRRELRQRYQQAAAERSSHRGTSTAPITGLITVQGSADSTADAVQMQYIKSPYRFDKNKSTRKPQGENTGTSKAYLQQPSVPPLVINTHRVMNKQLDYKLKETMNRLPALLPDDTIASDPQKALRQKRMNPVEDMAKPTEIARDTTLTMEQELILARITEKKPREERKEVMYHLPALQPRREQVFYQKPTENHIGKVMWTVGSPKKTRATVLPPLPPLRETNKSEMSINEAARTIFQVITPTVINYRELSPTGGHLEGQGLSLDNDYSHKSTASTRHRAIIKTRTERRRSGSTGKDTDNKRNNKKKIVHFAPDVKDYNRESKPNYRRQRQRQIHPDPMRVMELVVHCHGNEPLDLPNVVEKYMLRAVPKVNV